MEEKATEMVETIRAKYGFSDEKVLQVMSKIPRHEFVKKSKKLVAYEDRSVSIGYGQTIGQPYTVALMTHLATESSKRSSKDLSAISKFEFLNESQKSKFKNQNAKLGRVLEIGTGSGYQTAVLSRFFNKVYSIEIIPALAKKARKTLEKSGYKNVYVKTGSGEWGWEEKSPFDAIIVTAGMEKVPERLFEQLKVGGVLVAPVGIGNDKEMLRVTKKGVDKLNTEKFGKFKFVPFVIETVKGRGHLVRY